MVIDSINMRSSFGAGSELVCCDTREVVGRGWQGDKGTYPVRERVRARYSEIGWRSPRGSGEPGTEKFGAGLAPGVLVELASHRTLEVGGLDEEEQLVDPSDGDFREHARDRPEPHQTEVLHGFLGGDEPRGAEDSQGPPAHVGDDGGSFLKEPISGDAFVTDDLRDDGLLHLGEDHAFGLAQGYLVADLEEVAGGVGRFTVGAADGEPHVAGGTFHFFDVSGNTDGGEMEHDAHTDPGAEVCRTGGEIPELWGIGEIKPRFELVVDGVGVSPSLIEGQPRTKGLNSEMVLFVDHDREAMLGCRNADAARVVRAGSSTLHQFADEVSFDEEHAFGVVELLNVDPGHF